MKNFKDRSRDETLIQIGKTMGYIEFHNREIAKIDREINRWPRRKTDLKLRKIMLQDQISNHQKYINQLEEDIKKLQE